MTINVDQQELAKFSSLASEWWDLQGPCKPLHDINPLRVGYIVRFAQLAGKKVLDVGCGGGILSESLAERGAQVVAIDASEAAIVAAREHIKNKSIEIDYQVTTAESLAATATQRESFDLITCMELLEHVPDPAQLIQTCAQLLKPQGQLFISTINRTLKAYLFAIIGAEYLLKLLPQGTHQYEKFIRPSELAQWLTSAGLKLCHLTGMTYNPLMKSYKLSNDNKINYLAYCQKP